MVKSRYIVEDGQSIYDVSILLFGHQDGVFSLINDNPDLDIDVLTAGMLLYYTPQVLDKVTLELYTKRNYKPATSDDINYAPLPPEPIPANSVIIHLYGLSDVTIEAPGEYTVAPSVVEFEVDHSTVALSPGETITIPACPTFDNVVIKDSAGNVMYVLSSGAEQILPDIQAKNSDDEIIGTATASHVIPIDDITVTEADGTTSSKPAGQDVSCAFPELNLKNTIGDLLELIASYPSGGDVVAWNAQVKNSLGTLLANIPSGTEHILSDIILTEVNGSTTAKAAGINVACQWINLLLKDTAGSTLSTISAFPALSTIVAPDATVNRDGVFYGNVKSGGSINVPSAGITPSGILYKRPLIEQKASYINYDFGYYVQNGDLAFNTPANPEFIQDLDIADTNWFYRLKYNNAFGNKYRFTNSVGNPASDTLANFIPADYTSGGGIDLYVIDHLTGFGYYVANLGSFSNWTDAINAVRTNNPSFIGMSGWLPLYRSQVIGLFRISGPYHNSSNIFKRGTVSGYNETQFWTGETLEQSSTNALLYNDSNNLRSFAKSSTTATIYMWRKHY